MFRPGRRRSGVLLVLAALLALGASRPHDHGEDGAPAQACAVCHFAHDRSLSPAPDVVLPGARETPYAEPVSAPRLRPTPVLQDLPRSRAPPA